LSEKLKTGLIYGISIAFIAINLYLIIQHDFYWFLLFPVLVLLFFVYFFALDKFILLIVFSTPLAINFRDFEAGFGISLPTEPMMFAVLVIFIIRLFYSFPFDKKILKHPVTVFILIHLAWMLITVLTSEMPLVSLKAFIARLWFVIPFFFLGTQIFRKPENVKAFLWAYMIPLIGVVSYTIIHHSSYGFGEEQGHWVMWPFYNDHTAYGAVIALFIPTLLGFVFNKDQKSSFRVISLIIFVFLVAALIFSYSRASWIGLAASFLIFGLIYFRIKFRYVFTVIAAFLFVFFYFQHQIIDTLERNKQDSSSDLVEHIHSIYNISTDASNLERINRWQSALRMFAERPVFGYGPGTYQFLYAPFQRTKEKTIISTNAGDLGNAHSEYIGPMAEQGIMGLLGFFFIGVFTIWTGIRLYRRAASKEVRLTAVFITLGLITYFIHGFLNNFLDTDKASVPFWGFIAILVSYDLYYGKKEVDNGNETN